ncbi:HAMP domain-containing sensor histidine kinase [Bradyrhizobium sp.]|uniref:sensor histidine kinase n=1 Tax=Bradyrhizobium sp. TaxID=376 RepID=UPI0027359EF6|nr:HAMP domain-containing sensor histidine kinase [Bradyrhizobium sp.]MDP3692451.1 HAMP domain-containing sensor histidine kinase [Bradyrhizobium sp.]
MTDESANTRRKWRPSLSLVVFFVLTSVLALPLFSIYFLKVYQNQLIQQAEAELIAQSTVLAATFRREVETGVPQDVALGARIPPTAAKPSDQVYQPIWPELELVSESVLPPRPAARPPTAPADPAFAALGARMAPDLVATQKVTLAGFRLLDPNGVVIAGREEVGLSLAHVEEVGEALQGSFKGVLRVRISKHEQPSLYSMRRGTGMRVFIAMPVILRDQVAGVVYASRTPSNVFKYMYEQRSRVILAILSMIVPTLLIGFLFHRTITGPMRELVERTNLVGKGDRDALRPLRHHGTSEFALLSQSFLDMARRLNTRSSFISTFATHVSHELKSPLTSIKGAAELLREDVDAPDMDDADRRKFLDNIIADADRLGTIAGRLRDFARAENPIALGAAKLSVAVAALRSAFPSLDVRAGGELDTPMRISEDNLLIILSNLADNAVRHGASRLEASAVQQDNQLKVTVSDDGEGVSPNNRAQIFDSFFTTRRDSGGTGMGLAIVRAMLDAHGGAVKLLNSEKGTAFELTFPVADAAAS